MMNDASTATRWERWTIDEIADGVARVLVARETPEHPTDALEALRAPVRSATAAAAGPDETQRHAMAAEDRIDAWASEVGLYLEEERLSRFVDRLRLGKPGLPGQRALREGDVFYVELPADRTFEGIGERVGTAEPALDLLDRYEAAGVDVLDVTAAARQSAKVAYQRAIGASSAAGDHDG